MNKITRMLLMLAAVAAASGCYTQRPLEVTPPTPPMHLIAQLTDSGTVAMGNAIGPGAIEVEGTVRAANEQQWTLQLSRVYHRDGRTIMWNQEPVIFPANVLTKPTVKVLDRRKSWLAAGGIVIGAFLVARTFDLAGIGEEDDQEEQPQQIIIPVGGR